MENNSTSAFMGVLIAAVMYTAFGFLAGVIYTFIAPSMSLPVLSIPVLLGIWWLWFLLFAPIIVFYVSVFRATDPLAKLANAMDTKVPGNSE